MSNQRALATKINRSRKENEPLSPEICKAIYASVTADEK